MSPIHISNDSVKYSRHSVERKVFAHKQLIKRSSMPGCKCEEIRTQVLFSDDAGYSKIASSQMCENINNCTFAAIAKRHFLNKTSDLATRASDGSDSNMPTDSSSKSPLTGGGLTGLLEA
jgi:hypothetical protein